jgi:hypothetical protein
LKTLPETPHQTGDDGVTLAAVGVAAYLIADVVHEVIGHGTACLLHGARITLLTSVYFRCSLRTPFIAVAGPTANLVAAGLAWFVQRRYRLTDARFRLLVLMTFAFNLLWGAGSMVYHSITNQDDWAIAVASLEPLWLWRIALVVLGSGLYVIGMRRVVRTLSVFVAADPSSASDRARRLVLVPYAAAGAAACVAAGFYIPDPLRAVREGALETYAASVGVLFPAVWIVKPADALTPLPYIEWSGRWVGAVAVAFMIFSALLGYGMR